MRLTKARVQGYRSIIDTGYFDVENDKTIFVGPNEAGKTAILQALQKLNSPEGTVSFDPLRDYPRSKYDEDIKNGKVDPSKFTVVEGHFILEDEDKEDIPEEYQNAVYVFGRRLDNTAWHKLDNAPEQLLFSDIEKDLLKLCQHYKNTSQAKSEPEAKQTAIQSSYDSAITGLQRTSTITAEKAKKITDWVKNNVSYLADDNATEEMHVYIIAVLETHRCSHIVATTPRRVYYHKHSIRLNIRQYTIIISHSIRLEQRPTSLYRRTLILCEPTRHIVVSFKTRPSLMVVFRTKPYPIVIIKVAFIILI